MRARAAVLLVAVVLVAGCGGSHKTAKPNGEAGKSPTQVLADAQRAASSASSLRMSGHVVSSGTPVSLDLSIARSKGAAGSMTTSGYQFRLVRIGNTVYILGSDAFYRHYAGAAAQLLHGKWLKASTTHGQFAQLAPLTSASALFGQIAKHHGKLVNEGAKTYQGQKVVEIRDTSDNSKLYVAASGTPYPLAVVGGTHGESGTIMFDRWNQPVSLSAPKGAIDISKLGAG